MVRYSSYDDAMLLRLLQQSDERAFTEIYNRYWKRLYAIAWHHYPSRETAEDIIHDIFSAIWRRREMLDIQSLPNYLATAVKHRVFNEVAKQQRKEFSIAEGTAENLADFRFTMEMVHQEINRLPEKSRIVFQHSRLQGKPNKQIARELNISEKAVEKHISKALKILRAQLHSFLLFNFF